ncbi:amidohydrolase family protein [Horticoccus luteus]|uniref:Amidohydrolase family protein n=1 Tax=Horticoccus luteus TaxID=2862869 RepID=A0A8F9TTN4_9BACT|nr:amidohydrolase family protein [Horticoccus luteus]QYM78856.1 amidohydrolase family protein [Horticoccus luteus]
MRISFPGLVDLQVNGFAGIDFNTPGRPPEQLATAFAAMRTRGVTRCLPTLITSSFERFAACARALAACNDPAIAGLHMEGPYLSPIDGARGAHPLAHVIPPSLDDFLRRQDAAGGRIVLVTLAPEVPGALALIEALAARGIRVAVGHTLAGREQIRDAVSAGATLSTHLGNGCPAQLPRHPNVIWEQLAEDGLSASLIVDGHHLPPSVVKSMIRAKGLARSILVTDAVAAACAPPGRYQLSDMEVVLDVTGRVSAAHANHLAGSSLALDTAVANTARFCGLALEEVLPLATTNPARLIGIAPAGQVTAEWNPESCHLTLLHVTGD